jgi:hypothetical protein
METFSVKLPLEGSFGWGRHEDDKRVRNYFESFVLEGLPAGWYAAQKTYESNIQFTSDEVMRSNGFAWTWIYGGGRPSRTETADILGWSNRSRNSSKEMVYLFHAREDTLQETLRRSQVVAVDGTATFVIARPKILQTVPLRLGASATTPHTRYTIREVRHEPEAKVKFTIETATVPWRNTLIPGVEEGLGRNNEVFLGNPKTKRFYSDPFWRSAANMIPGFYSVREITINVSASGSMDDLCLFIVTSEVAGEVQIPFHYEGKEAQKWFKM